MSLESDSEYRQFVLDLDDSDISMSEWETEFIASLIERDQTRFSEKQKAVLDRMVDKYDHLI